jgi:hypothetical protein
MDAQQLQDRLNWGLNRAAKVLGKPADAFRPEGPGNPLRKVNRFLRLPAMFSPADGNLDEVMGFGNALWRGHFDGAYTRPGDYLVQDEGIWFIASQHNLSPILCVKTNAVITISRPIAPDTGTAYGSTSLNSTVELITQWPASVLGVTTAGHSPSNLPTASVIPRWTVIIPSSHRQTPRKSDIVTYNDQNNGTIAAVEQSDLGWRLIVHQATA